MQKTASLQKPTKQPTKLSHQEPHTELTLLEHVHELRNRLFWVGLTLAVASAVGFQLKDQLIAVITSPLQGEALMYLTPGGGLSFIVTLSLYFGILFTIPVITYQLYKFLQPIIGVKSRKLLIGILSVSSILAITGVLFGYFVTIPAALNFLANFGGEAVTASLTAESYLNFVASYIVGLALLFQLPLILFIIDHVRPLPPGALAATQQYVVIGATVLAAVITPTPDAFNMAIVAMPIVAVYETGAATVYFRRKANHIRTSRRAAANAKVAAALDMPVFRDEDQILTTILEEMDMQNETEMQKAVLAPVTAPVPVEVPQSAEPEPYSPPNRSIDGFSRRTTVSPQLRVPARHTKIPDRQRVRRPVRSIDGFF